MAENVTTRPVASPAARPRPKTRRIFYIGSAVLILLVMLVGFRHFYLEGRAHPGRDIPPPLRTLVVVHGVSMSLWVLLFLAQSVLIAARRPKVHMQMGRVGAVLALGIFISGLMLSVQSARTAPPGMMLWGMTMPQFMAVPFFSIWLFAAMVAAGIYYRRRPEIHRPMMLFATVGALSAATARIDFFNALYQGTRWETIFGPFLVVLVLGAALVAARWIQTRSFDKWFAAGYGIVLVALMLTIQIARTSPWENFAQWLIR